MIPPWMLAVTLSGVIIVGAVILAIVRKEHRPPDYFTLFMIGLIWFPVGLVIQTVGIWVMGLVSMTYALVHRDQWHKNRRGWEHMDDYERTSYIIILGILTILVITIVGYTLFFV